MSETGQDIQAIPETGATILVVDDTPANLKLLFQVLSGQGYQVRAVPSGERALESVRAAVPDLILLDIMMPEMDGYQISERLKQDERTRDIPIIFISALDAVKDKVDAFRAGGVDYVTKPFQFEEVLARVETHLKLRALQKQLAQRVCELEEALAQVKTLRGLLPICANCKKVRDDQGYWQDVEVYVRDHSDVDFSHGICPDCFKQLYPEYVDIIDKSGNEHG
ncbi:MAG: response regulator [Anaerolineae bacterium]|nr:response regulator [Anaerolineae bacterium]